MDLLPDRVNYALADDVIEDRFEVTDGTMPVPDDLGLGVTVDEKKVEEYRVESSEGISYDVLL